MCVVARHCAAAAAAGPADGPQQRVPNQLPSRTVLNSRQALWAPSDRGPNGRGVFLLEGASTKSVLQQQVSLSLQWLPRRGPPGVAASGGPAACTARDAAAAAGLPPTASTAHIPPLSQVRLCLNLPQSKPKRLWPLPRGRLVPAGRAARAAARGRAPHQRHRSQRRGGQAARGPCARGWRHRCGAFRAEEGAAVHRQAQGADRGDARKRAARGVTRLAAERWCTGSQSRPAQLRLLRAAGSYPGP